MPALWPRPVAVRPDRQTKGIGPFYIADGRMWRPLKVAEADQWLNRRGKYVVYAACLSLSLPSIIAIKAVTGSERRSHSLDPGPAMPLLCLRRSEKHQIGTWTPGRARSEEHTYELHTPRQVSNAG